MAVFNEPSKWQTSLVNSGDANTIPQSTPAGTGEASFEDGFPPITQVPIGAGGQAPNRKDFNGLFKILGDWIFYAQNGGLPTYSADFDYIVGRYVVYNGTLYKCIQANGASSTIVAPDSVSPAGSDYWVQVATLADFANFANTDLSNLSASGQALFTNKADKDFSNVTAPVQAFKDMSIGWVMPDYSAGIAISAVPFTAPSDGIAVYEVGSGNQGKTYVNGVFVGTSSNSNADSSSYVLLAKNDVLTANDNPKADRCIFYPFKGV